MVRALMGRGTGGRSSQRSRAARAPPATPRWLPGKASEILRAVMAQPQYPTQPKGVSPEWRLVKASSF